MGLQSPRHRAHPGATRVCLELVVVVSRMIRVLEDEVDVNVSGALAIGWTSAGIAVAVLVSLMLDRSRDDGCGVDSCRVAVDDVCQTHHRALGVCVDPHRCP